MVVGARPSRAASSSPSSPREERAGRGPRRGETNKNAPPLPQPSPPSDRGEGEIEELDAALATVSVAPVGVSPTASLPPSPPSAGLRRRGAVLLRRTGRFL